jgi:hypothetical protein
MIRNMTMQYNTWKCATTLDIKPIYAMFNGGGGDEVFLILITYWRIVLSFASSLWHMWYLVSLYMSYVYLWNKQWHLIWLKPNSIRFQNDFQDIFQPDGHVSSLDMSVRITYLKWYTCNAIRKNAIGRLKVQNRFIYLLDCHGSS